MKRALCAFVFLAAASAYAEPIEGNYEVTKVDDKPASELLKAPETVWARYVLSYGEGKVAAKVEVIHKTKDADRFLLCNSTVAAPVTWKGDAYTVADDVSAESHSVTMVKSKEENRTKLTTEAKTCAVFIKKGTYKVAKTKEGAKLTRTEGGVFTLVPAQDPNFADIVSK